MVDRSLDLLQSVLNGLSAGTDPARLLHDGLSGAVAATGGTEGAVLRLGATGEEVLATSGHLSAAARATARAAAEGGRLVRRRDPQTGLTTAAEPLRTGARVVGAVVVSGALDRLDPAPLPLYAAALAVVLQRHTPVTPELLPEVFSSLAAAAGQLDPAAVAAVALDGARALFGGASGLCALSTDGPLRVTNFRGIAAERLVAASRHPEFRAFLSGERLRVDEPTHPVVAQLGVLSEVAVGVPLSAGGRSLGRLVLLLAATPGPAERSLLTGFADYVAVCLLTSQLGSAVADHEQRLTSLAHSVAQPVVMVDVAGCLVEVNGAAANAFSLASGFERGRPVVGRLGHPALEEMLTSGRETSAEVVVGSGEQRVYRASVRRMRGSDGRVTGRVLVMDDVTGQRQMDALKADFVAVIGHELRTPITVIKGYMQTLVRRGDSLTPERKAQALNALESNVNRLERLIEDLLFMSAIEQRSAAMDVRPHDLSALLRAEANARVVVTTPPRPVEVQVDDARLARVLHHLLSNALEHSDGEVRLELVEAEGEVEVSVTDTGPGIFSGDLPYLFDRFRQLDSSSTRTHGGVGIGLYICRRVVEALGGRIWCESRLGVGSRFIFTLPTTPVTAGSLPTVAS